MLVYFLSFLSVMFGALLLASVYFIWKFSKIIMVFEDDISDTVGTLNDVEDAIDNVLKMEIFFESTEVRKEVEKILDEVRYCRMSINGMVKRFTSRSKQNYYFVEPEPPRYMEQPQEQEIRLPGQPPNTPNPLKAIMNSYD